jgi:phosphoribosyl-dephospho-CoA transferase
VPDPAPARHDLVWLAPGWRSALVAPADAAVLDALEDWFGRGLPAVVCRRDPASPGALALGVALPPGGPVPRAALLVDRAAAVRTAPPLALTDVVPSAPVGWCEKLGALDADASAAGLALRVYGSLAWQHLSGARYLTSTSDVDLLVSPANAAELRRTLALLAGATAGGGPRLDGEILLPSGRGVSWRELAVRPPRVLVRFATGVALEPTCAALGALAEGLA